MLFSGRIRYLAVGKSKGESIYTAILQ
jgi:hypothetical protein